MRGDEVVVGAKIVVDSVKIKAGMVDVNVVAIVVPKVLIVEVDIDEVAVKTKEVVVDDNTHSDEYSD